VNGVFVLYLASQLQRPCQPIGRELLALIRVCEVLPYVEPYVVPRQVEVYYCRRSTVHLRVEDYCAEEVVAILMAATLIKHRVS
jgi:hypothetical protein